MQFIDLIKQKKNSILKNWLDIVLETYPSDTYQIFNKIKDPFSNPVGSIISTGLNNLFDELMKDEIDQNGVKCFLDPIIRVRAVQNFSPSKAVAFIFYLKNVFYEYFKSEISEGKFIGELILLNSKIDELGFIAFDILMECKEKIFEIRVSEFRKLQFMNEQNKVRQR